jgi:plasmid stabilization system protein ParE
MTHFLVVTTERAAREIEDAAAWWASERSIEQADRWYQGIRTAIIGLADMPERYAIAAESPEFPYELRELHFGLGSKPTHRVLFTIVGETMRFNSASCITCRTSVRRSCLTFVQLKGRPVQSWFVRADYFLGGWTTISSPFSGSYRCCAPSGSSASLMPLA